MATAFDQISELFPNSNVVRLFRAVPVWQWVVGIWALRKTWNYYRDYVPIPAYGGILRFSQILSAIRLMREEREFYKGPYDEHDLMWFPRLESWVVYVGPRLLDEMIRAPDEELSFMDANHDSLHIEYSFGKRITEVDDHIVTIQSQLTRHLIPLCPEIYDEIDVAFNELQLDTKEWRKFQTFPLVLDIVARASNRAFVGMPLCRNLAYLDFQKESPPVVLGTGILLNMLPSWLIPIVGPIMAPIKRRLPKSVSWTRSVIEEHLRLDPSERPDDVITWLLSNAPESDQTVEEITRRIDVLNFAAIHTSTMNFTAALYWLVARPEYVAPLRREIEEVTERLGWTKQALGEMYLLESFMKESFRMTPSSSQALTRKSRKPFTFSNGVTIPAGTYLGAHLWATHHDPDIYEDPDHFDGYRFLDEKHRAGYANSDVIGEDDAEDVERKARRTMYTTSKTYLAFSHGRHACPGRFFAVMELKLLMAYMAYNFDFKWPEEEIPRGMKAEEYYPKPMHFNLAFVPNRTAHILIRKRAGL